MNCSAILNVEENMINMVYLMINQDDLIQNGNINLIEDRIHLNFSTMNFLGVEAIFIFSDWCFTCLRIEPIWSKLTEELEPVGFGVVTVHSGRQRELARKIGSNELPHIAFLLDGKIFHYKEGQFSALRILDFVRSKLPFKMVERI